MIQLSVESKQQGFSLVAAMASSAVLGIAVIVLALSMYSGEVSTEQVFAQPSVEFGRRLIRETSAMMGPGHEDPAKRFSGSNLDCASCHLDTGTEPGTLSLLLADTKYPRFSGRDGVEETCVTASTVA